MGGCASKPKEFDTTRPEALPADSNRPEKADPDHEAVDTTNTTNVEAEAPLAKPEAEVVATQKPKEEKVADQVEVAARQLAEVNLVEAAKETKEKDMLAAQEIKPKAKEEEQPAADIIKPKAKEEEPAADIKPKAKKEEDVQDKDAPILTV
ncbi:triadin [Prunus yedoensis var. nudiflora]|uniref:Triadin n=1 Tax=Prunus yedoensis var. nudiflora TaxID=2094558 RepID=A0A314UUT8_PRUYE|nr:triadin [Prunus yedoensis var. nudiflora]